MTPPAIAAYSDIHAYLFAIRDTHLRVLDCWTSLSSSQRQRRKWTGVNEGGVQTEEIDDRRRLTRLGWGTVRAMLFFLDQLQGHFMMDIIDVQHRRLLEQLDLVDNNEAIAGAAHAGTGFGSGLGRSTRGSRKSSIAPTSPATSMHKAAAGPPRINATYAPSPIGETRPDSPYSGSQGGFDNHTVHSNRELPTPSKAPFQSQYQTQSAFLDFLTLR